MYLIFALPALASLKYTPRKSPVFGLRRHSRRTFDLIPPTVSAGSPTVSSVISTVGSPLVTTVGDVRLGVLLSRHLWRKNATSRLTQNALFRVLLAHASLCQRYSFQPRP